MGTLNTFYVRGNKNEMAPAIRKVFPSAAVEAGSEFYGVILDVELDEPPTEVLTKLSFDLSTDIIWLSFQSVVDAFQFHHWRSGSPVRSLVFGCYGDEERTWNHVYGEPEPWEQQALFDPEQLDFMLREIAQSDDEKREFERIWREREIVPGRQEPGMDAREVARKIAKHYRFPGWG